MPHPDTINVVNARFFRAARPADHG